MADTPPFSSLNLMTIPFDEHDCIFDNKFLLAGYYNHQDHKSLISDPTMQAFLTAPYPFKIQFTMIHLCIEGSMRVRLNLNEYELHQNSLLIVTPGSIGQCLDVSPDCHIILAAFASNFIFTEDNSEGALIVRKFLTHQSLLPLSEVQTSEILAIYQALYNKLQQPDFHFKQEILKGYLQVLYGEICQLMAPHVEHYNTHQGSRKKQIFDHFIAELRQHYTSERSIGYYADRLCLTPKYLSQVVHAVSGRHAGEWIRDYVILEAKALLKSRQYSVQQIADLLNFANQSFFGVYFKKAVGCSPTAYQNTSL